MCQCYISLLLWYRNPPRRAREIAQPKANDIYMYTCVHEVLLSQCYISRSGASY